MIKDTQKADWFQPLPALNLSLIIELAKPKDSSIIDIGVEIAIWWITCWLTPTVI